MSDLAPETQTDPTDQLLPDVPDLASAVAALETRVSALEAGVTRWAPPSGTTTLTHTDAFDTQARVAELVQQGLSEADAISEAAYEERRWNDQHPAQTPAA